MSYASIYAITSYFAYQQSRARNRGGGEPVTRYDLVVGATAALLAVAWAFADLGPGWLALHAVTADAFALWPTLRYAWSEPSTGGERQVWAADTVAAALGLSAATLPWTAAAVAYPVYLVLGNGSVIAIMRRRRGAIEAARPDLARPVGAATAEG